MLTFDSFETDMRRVVAEGRAAGWDVPCLWGLHAPHLRARQVYTLLLGGEMEPAAQSPFAATTVLAVPCSRPAALAALARVCEDAGEEACRLLLRNPDGVEGWLFLVGRTELHLAGWTGHGWTLRHRLPYRAAPPAGESDAGLTTAPATAPR